MKRKVGFLLVLVGGTLLCAPQIFSMLSENFFKPGFLIGAVGFLLLTTT